jgi:hypothetical protein
MKKRNWLNNNGETPMEIEMIEKTKDRFDLEQEILECWKVTNDIQMYIDQGAATEDFKVLIDYYERKFNCLWETFESMVHERKM